MVRARADFLDAGHYWPIAQAVAASVVAGLASSSGPAGTGLAAPLVLDLAGGTGYYLAAVLDALSCARGLVLDRSPAAAKRAARCHPRAAAATADAWRPLPLRDSVVSHAISVFGPRGAVELARVTAPGGGLTVVTPGARHLTEVRAGGWLLGIGGEKEAKLDAALEGFELARRERLEHVARLDRRQATNLVMMGPNAFHTTRTAVDERLEGLSWPLATTVEVVVSRYRRRSERN
jgi:23S rRNA (guanine745-N1)-methyltransferase